MELRDGIRLFVGVGCSDLFADLALKHVLGRERFASSWLTRPCDATDIGSPWLFLKSKQQLSSQERWDVAPCRLPVFKLGGIVKGIVIKRFDNPDRPIDLVNGSLQVVEIGGVVLGRAEYEPGWLWSRDVAGDEGKALCSAAHVGLVLQGENRVTMADGTTVVMGPGDLFEIGPGHESEVVGNQNYVSIHLSGLDEYLEGM